MPSPLCSSGQRPSSCSYLPPDLATLLHCSRQGQLRSDRFWKLCNQTPRPLEKPIAIAECFRRKLKRNSNDRRTGKDLGTIKTRCQFVIGLFLARRKCILAIFCEEVGDGVLDGGREDCDEAYCEGHNNDNNENNYDNGQNS